MADGGGINQAIHLLSWAAIVLGSFFTIAGAVGLVRMPDVFTRMHAASVTETLGAGLLLFGMMMQAGATLVTVKLIFIGGLLFVTAPVVTHALAQAALHYGIKPYLHEDRRQGASGAGPAAGDGALDDEGS